VSFEGRAGNHETLVMPGLDPPARPKPLRRGEGPGIHVFGLVRSQDVDGRVKPGHDSEDLTREKF
jgi:hypothetical protein